MVLPPKNLFGLTPVFKACNAVGSGFVGLFVEGVVEGVIAGTGVVGLVVVGLEEAAPAMLIGSTPQYGEVSSRGVRNLKIVLK